MTPALMLVASIASAGPSTITAPPPAAQAGYTTLAFRSDFTAPIMGNVGNWLDCAGAPRPKWWIAGFYASSPPCERARIVRDGDRQALDMTFTVDDNPHNGLQLTSVPFQSGTYDRGVDLPNGAYYQITLRVSPQSINNNTYAELVGSFWTWSDTAALGSSPSWAEFDPIELYANGGNPPAGHGYDDSAAGFYNPRCCGFDFVLDGWGDAVPSGNSTYYPVDQSQYFTIGYLTTQDGKDISICNYLNGVFDRCKTATQAGMAGLNDSIFNQRNYLILLVGLSSDTVPVKADMDMFVRDVQVWTCPAGVNSVVGVPGHACNGSLVE